MRKHDEGSAGEKPGRVVELFRGHNSPYTDYELSVTDSMS